MQTGIALEQGNYAIKPKKNSKLIRGNIVEIKTKANEMIMVFPEGKDLRSWSVVTENPLANEK